MSQNKYLIFLKKIYGYPNIISFSLVRRRKKGEENGDEEGEIVCECGANMADEAANEGQELPGCGFYRVLFGGHEAFC